MAESGVDNKYFVPAGVAFLVLTVILVTMKTVTGLTIFGLSSTIVIDFTEGVLDSAGAPLCFKDDRILWGLCTRVQLRDYCRKSGMSGLPDQLYVY